MASTCLNCKKRLGCGCQKAITTGNQPQTHTIECHVRIEEAIAETEEGKIR